MNGIYFPGIGISFPNVSSGITIFGFEIKFYAIVITLGFVFATLISQREARLSGQDPEDYLDFVLAMVIPVIIGARLYYIIFNHESFFGGGKTAWQTFVGLINLRNGGLAIYGGLIAGTITAIIFGKKKKITMPLMWDTVSMGVLFGQMLGRWGNFFNRECYGGYYSGTFRMAIPYDYYSTQFKAYLSDVGIVTQEMLDNMEMVKGVQCITVHPTFIYEILWNVALLAFILFWWKKKRFDGEITMFYFFGYGVGRFIIEGIRADTLMFGPFKISQLVSVVFIIVTVTILLKNYISISKGKEPVLHRLGDEKNEKVENDEKEGKHSTKNNNSRKKKKK